ncbi:hypothetical protein Tco_1210805 [Tanacetum coccineum]
MKHLRPTTPDPKTLHEHSRPTSSGFQNPITVPTEQTGRIVDSCDIWLIQNTCTFQGLRTKDPLRHVKQYLSIVDNIQADGATRDTSRLRFFNSPQGTRQNGLTEYPPLKSRRGIRSCHDSSTISFRLDNDDTSPWGNNKRKEKGEDGPEWIVKHKFEDELANFMFEKKSHAKGIGDMLVQHRK